MRVLHVTSGKLFGGIETFQLALVDAGREHAPDTEHRFAVFFDGRFWNALQERQVPSTLLGRATLSRPWTVLRAALALRRAVVAHAADVVVLHSTWTQALFLPILRSLPVPVVLYFHAAKSEGWPDRFGTRLAVDGVVAVSQSVLDGWLPTVQRWQCAAEVIHCPAQLPAARARIHQRSEVRILLAARVEAGKGHRPLLEALGKLRLEPGWRCQIAGGAQSAEEQVFLNELQELSLQLGIAERVEFLGQRPDVPALMAAADIYCQPNLGPEGLGLSFVEAMATGLPVVTSEIGAAREVVGDAGLLLPVGDVGRLSESLLELIRSPAERARWLSLAPAQARRICDPVERVRDTEAFLRRIAGQR